MHISHICTYEGASSFKCILHEFQNLGYKSRLIFLILFLKRETEIEFPSLKAFSDQAWTGVKAGSQELHRELAQEWTGASS